MKYTVGYYGNCSELEEKLVDYCNLPENEIIKYVNISNMSKEQVDATAFNGFIFDTTLHSDEKANELIVDIIKDNRDI